MTPTRAAAAIGGTALLAAWFASAAGMRVDEAQPAARLPAAQAAPDPGTLADSVQAQAERLRARLDAAPVPREPARNPFRFDPRDQPPERVGTARSVAPAAEAPAPAPFPLALVAIAEQRADAGPERTAVVSGLGDLFLAKVGDELAGRYRIVAIGPDAAEILDAGTGRTVILTLD